MHLRSDVAVTVAQASAATLIRPLARELPYAAGAALKRRGGEPSPLETATVQLTEEEAEAKRGLVPWLGHQVQGQGYSLWLRQERPL